MNKTFAFGCSNVYDEVVKKNIQMWKYYRYSLVLEYEEKPTLAPPIIAINLLWRTVKFIYKKRCCCQESKPSDRCHFYSTICIINRLLEHYTCF